MKKLLLLAMCLVVCLTACARAEALTGKAEGYGGELTVKVTLDGKKITAVEVTQHTETEGVGTMAIDQLPEKIVAANSTDVDIVSGATITSKAIIAAVNNAMEPEKYPYGATTQPTALSADTYLGLGTSSSGRVGPGTDTSGAQVYSFNEVLVSALFDKDGRVIDIYIDQLEVATPNYASENKMPFFSGYPGQTGYGAAEITDDSFLAEVSGWITKRERGSIYKMTTGTWASQMDTYQRIFIGKTVDEIDAWFTSYCSDTNGRPLKADSTNETDKAKYEALTDEDKTMLADVTTSATMSLKDSHGDVLAAIRNAYDNRRALTSVK